MNTLRSYPGVLALLIIAAGLLVHGLIGYLNYEIAGPSVLAAIGCLTSAILLIGVYRFKSTKSNAKPLKT